MKVYYVNIRVVVKERKKMMGDESERCKYVLGL